ncbi:MAG: aspartate carbamoyltransferase catalytic subunit [bacterium]|nr:aspartate carbamoyltransferase catalytic subunit [bacterium]
MLKTKDLLGLENLTKKEIELILDTAINFKGVFTRSVKKVPALRGKTVVNLFYEPSTRTSKSFEVAAQRLSADVIDITTSMSSVVKGESLIDIGKTLEAMKADFVVIRHAMAGTPKILAENISAAVINAGDGFHEHPTQGLLDLYTIRENLDEIKGLKVVIVGDIGHSRVAKSNILALNKFGAKVTVVGPPTLIPDSIKEMGVDIEYNLKKALENADVVNILRIQLERQNKNLFPSLREYTALYKVTPEILKYAKKSVLIMHPGPMNRGIEISSEVVNLKNAVINEQVTNGIAIRMAILYLLAKANK